ncbi:MAG: rhodanese-like domain-containing protein [Streptosporangiales bacterium]|nr:rhodanese-like domain-containing protein [Streptosporangiales bacterium]
MSTEDTISRKLREVREELKRYTAEEAAAAMERGALLIDLRPVEYRLRNGEVPGAITVSRHMLEWRLDVTSDRRLKELAHGDAEREIVLFCNEGYTSSLAAYQVMRDIGLTNVTDIVGGFDAWRDADLPVQPRTLTVGSPKESPPAG